jgi:hypothetical protein
MLHTANTDLEALTLTAAREAVLSGATSAVALATAHYDRIAAIDPVAAPSRRPPASTQQ